MTLTESQKADVLKHEKTRDFWLQFGFQASISFLAGRVPLFQVSYVGSEGWK